MSLKETNKSIRETFMSALEDKPVWVYWIAYSVLSGILFGIFYTAMHFLALQWWVAVLVIIAVGAVLGTISYTRNSKETIGKKEA